MSSNHHRFNESFKWSEHMATAGYNGNPSIPPDHPLARLFSDGAPSAPVGPGFDPKTSKVRFRRFDLDDEEERVDLENILTDCMRGQGKFLDSQTLHTTPDGRAIVTICWVEWEVQTAKRPKGLDDV